MRFSPHIYNQMLSRYNTIYNSYAAGTVRIRLNFYAWSWPIANGVRKSLLTSFHRETH